MLTTLGNRPHMPLGRSCRPRPWKTTTTSPTSTPGCSRSHGNFTVTMWVYVCLLGTKVQAGLVHIGCTKAGLWVFSSKVAPSPSTRAWR